MTDLIKEARRQEPSPHGLPDPEEVYRTFFRESPDAMFVATIEGKFADFNQPLLDLLGYTGEELSGMNISEAYADPACRDKFQQQIEKEGHVREYELRLRRKDGAEVGCLLSCAVMRSGDGSVLAYQGILREVTDQHHTTNALRQSEEQLRRLLDTLVEGVLLVDRDGRIAQANRAAERILGLSRSEIERRSYIGPEWQIVGLDGTPVPAGDMAGPRAIKENQPVRDVMMGVQRPDGTVTWVNVNATPLADAAGQVDGVVCAFADFTQSKKVEDALLRRSVELEALVRIARALARPGQFEHKADRVLREILDVVRADLLSLRMADRSKQGLRLIASAGPEAQAAAHVPVLSFKQGISSLAFEHGHPIVANDYRAHPRAKLEEVPRGMKSAVALPIKVEGRPVGTIFAGSMQANFFTPERILLLVAITDETAMFVENARLQQDVDVELRLRRRQLEALRSAAENLVFEDDPEHGLRHLLETLNHLVSADYCAAVIKERGSQEPRWITAGNGLQDPDSVASYVNDADLLKPILEKLKTVRIADITSRPGDSGTHPKPVAVKDLLGIPLLSNGRSYGALLLGKRAGTSAFSRETERLVNLFGLLIAVFLENRVLYEESVGERATLTAIQQSMAEGLLVCDARGRVMYFNKAMEILLGIPATEAEGKHVEDVVGAIWHGADSSQATYSFVELAERAQADSLSREITITGPQRRELALTVFPISMMRGERLTGSLWRDVTDRKRAETALRESEGMYRTLVNTLPEAVAITDLEGHFTYVSPQAVKMLGCCSADEMVGCAFSESMAPEQREEARAIFQHMLDGEGPRGAEYALLRKDGSPFFAEVSASAMRDATGRPRGLIATIRDVSGRRKAQEDLKVLFEQERHLRRELEAEIGRRTEFTRALVHELKTPLTALLASSEILAAGKLGEPWQKLAMNIHRGASNLNGRINELLDVARGEVGLLEVKRAMMDPMQLLLQVVDELGPSAAGRQQSLELDLPGRLPLVFADPVRVQQVVLNLLNNAIKFTPEGGKIVVKARRKNGNLVVEVQDTGPGIASEEQSRLFKPYRRLEMGREGYSGLGIGLALCKMVVELHKGNIWAESEEGRGSTFIFSLPLAVPD